AGELPQPLQHDIPHREPGDVLSAARGCGRRALRGSENTWCEPMAHTTYSGSVSSCKSSSSVLCSVLATANTEQSIPDGGLARLAARDLRRPSGAPWCVDRGEGHGRGRRSPCRMVDDLDHDWLQGRPHDLDPVGLPVEQEPVHPGGPELAMAAR